MAIVKEKYTAQKINLLFQLLQSDNEDGRPREYDICVDDLKVVRRTTDPEKFFSHEDFINEETNYITITLYEGTSKRNTRYVYNMKDGEVENTLSGIEQTVNDKIIAQRKQWDFEQLQKENEDLKGEMEEQNEYIEKLETMLEEEKTKKASIKDNWSEVFSLALEGMVRRNTHLLNGIPLIGQGLAGVVEHDNKRLEDKIENAESKTEERHASFQKINNGEKQLLNEEESKLIAYYKKLQQTFTKEELTTIIQIIGLFSMEKENIQTVYEMLSEEAEKEDEKEMS
jgi:hypothetical protein